VSPPKNWQLSSTDTIAIVIITVAVIPPTYGDVVLAVGRTLLRACVRVLLKSQLALRLLERFIMSPSFSVALTPLPTRTQTHHRHTQRYICLTTSTVRSSAQPDRYGQEFAYSQSPGA